MMVYYTNGGSREIGKLEAFTVTLKNKEYDQTVSIKSLSHDDASQ